MLKQKKKAGVNLNDFIVKKKTSQHKKKDKGAIKKVVPIVSKKKVKKSKKNNTKIKKNKESLFKYVEASRVMLPLIFLSFIKWNAFPPKDREPNNQNKFAAKFGISIDTLTNWKARDGFWDEVALYRDQYFRKSTSAVYYGLKERAKTGDPRAVELFAALFEGYKKRIGVEDQTPKELDPEQKDIINNALRHIGLASILNNSKEDD